MNPLSGILGCTNTLYDALNYVTDTIENMVVVLEQPGFQYVFCISFEHWNLKQFVPAQVNVMATHSQLPTLVTGQAKVYAKVKQEFKGYLEPYVVSMSNIKKTSGHTCMPLYKANTPQCMATQLYVVVQLILTDYTVTGIVSI